jgi:RNA polymerase sigma factor (sigma-70 family)
MDDSDGQLLAATARGDAEAFGRFYRRHKRLVLGYGVNRCLNAADVGDLLGETFLAALRSAPRFTDNGQDATAWLVGIARHVLAHQQRSFLRRQRLTDRLAALPSLSTDEANAVDGAIDAARMAPQLAAAMAALQPKDQELLLLVARDGLSSSQAGAVMGMNPNTARLRLSRARAQVRAALNPDDAAPTTDTQPEVPHARP